MSAAGGYLLCTFIRTHLCAYASAPAPIGPFDLERCDDHWNLGSPAGRRRVRHQRPLAASHPWGGFAIAGPAHAPTARQVGRTGACVICSHSIRAALTSPQTVVATGPDGAAVRRCSVMRGSRKATLPPRLELLIPDCEVLAGQGESRRGNADACSSGEDSACRSPAHGTRGLGCPPTQPSINIGSNQYPRMAQGSARIGLDVKIGSNQYDNSLTTEPWSLACESV